MSHLDIPACSRKHQHQCQFEWNREKTGSSHSLNLLFKVLTHYQLHSLKSCTVGCWLVPQHACSALDRLVLLETTHRNLSLGFHGRLSKWVILYRWTQHFIFQHRDRGKPTQGCGHTVSRLLTPPACENLRVSVGHRVYVKTLPLNRVLKAGGKSFLSVAHPVSSLHLVKSQPIHLSQRPGVNCSV